MKNRFLCHYRWLLALMILLPVLSFRSDVDPRLQHILERFKAYQDKFLQQKVYLHLDRKVYDAPGDIWFEGYVVSGPEQLPDSQSQNLYVELVNQQHSVVQTRLVRLSEGTGAGDFFLSDTAREGNYTIRGYTSWMSNFSQDFVFSKSIYIRNPNTANDISRGELRYNKRYNRQMREAAEKYDLQFLPEGGDLTHGFDSRIAFRAVNELGEGVQASGVVYKDKKEEVTRFSTSWHGLGSFRFKAEKGRKYQALVTIGRNKPFWKDLPEVLEYAFFLSIKSKGEELLQVDLGSSFPLTNDPQANDVMLVAQSHGKIFFSKLVDMPQGKQQVLVEKSLFPTGVAQFTLFNGRGVPMAERLVFINHHDWLRLSMDTAVISSAYRTGAMTSLLVSNPAGKPADGHFSASIALVDSTETSLESASIISGLYLLSDLKGAVEEPDSLVFGSSEQMKECMDLVMLVNGWRRYEWKEILAARWPDYGTPADQKISITGKITRELFGIPIPRANVYLSILNAYNDYFKTVADEKGRFRFDNLDYADTINVVMESNKPNGRKNVLINLTENQSPKLDDSKAGRQKQELIARGKNWKYSNVNDIYYKEETLEKKKKLEKIQPYKLHGDADNVIYMSDVPEGFTDLFQVIQGRVPGVSVVGDNVNIRGISTLYGNSDPLYLIDGVMVDKATFGCLIPRDVEVIEIIKGPGTAIYGSRGANGVIAAYTKRGEYGKKGYLEFSMLGYCTPRVYFSPRYDRDKGNPNTQDFRKTVLWAPNLIPDSDGHIGLRFYTSDVPGLYRLTVEGMDRKGRPGFYQYLFKTGN